MIARHWPILILFACCAAAPSVEMIADTVVDEHGIYLPNGQWGHTLNGRSFQQDAIASHNGWQYATYFDGERRLCIARRRLAETSWQVIRFDDYRFKGNDTHNAAALGICLADGTIHLSFDHHGHPLHYRVSQPGVASKPEAITWSAKLFGRITDQLEAGKKVTRVTYPRFIVTPRGALQFQCRIGGSGDGVSWIADYDAGRWHDFAPFISGGGTYEGGTSRNAYENGYTYDASGKLHVTWCWRETGNPTTNHDLCYAWSDDGGVTWRNNAAETIGRRGAQQITLDSPGVKVCDIPMNRGLINSTTQAIDRHGRLHVIARQLPDDTTAPREWAATVALTRFFHYWRDEQGQWQRTGMTFGGNRGQMCFDADDNAYLVFVEEGLRIAAAGAEQKWADWKIIHTDARPFTDQPLLDTGRVAKENVLSVYVQQAPPQPSQTSAPLRVLDYRLGGRAGSPATR